MPETRTFYSRNGFSTLVTISCADGMASVTSVDLNLFTIVSFSSRIWFEGSAFHWPCNGLMSESLGDTLTFEGSVATTSWANTCFENQLLHLLEINALADLLTDISKGWNLFLRLCGTMTTLHKF